MCMPQMNFETKREPVTADNCFECGAEIDSERQNKHKGTEVCQKCADAYRANTGAPNVAN